MKMKRYVVAVVVLLALATLAIGGIVGYPWD
jgi:hypothetical protein